MKTSTHHGVSFLEIAFAVLIMGLVVGPVISLVSNLNKSTSTSVYEMMASQYAAEILEQLRVLPLAAIKEANDGASLADLAPQVSMPPTTEILKKFLLAPGIYLMASRMPSEIFKSRVVSLKKDTKNAGATTVNLVKAVVSITWQTTGMKDPKTFMACTFLMEP